jgi:hypothetical protein
MPRTDYPRGSVEWGRCGSLATGAGGQLIFCPVASKSGVQPCERTFFEIFELLSNPILSRSGGF